MFTRKKVKILNQLSQAINREYGFILSRRLYFFKNYYPRITFGPCGAFAKTFFEVWNELFEEKVTICFLFSKSKGRCIHCFIKLPNGKFFDGGNKVCTINKYRKGRRSDTFFEEMKIYDHAELEKNADGLIRTYEHCPNYDNEKTRSIVKAYLTRLSESFILV